MITAEVIATFLGVAMPMGGVLLWFKSKSKDYDFGHQQTREEHKEILEALDRIREAVIRLEEK